MTVILPYYIINHILSYREVHPVSKIMKELIKIWDNDDKYTITNDDDSYHVSNNHFYSYHLKIIRNYIKYCLIQRKMKFPKHPISRLITCLINEFYCTNAEQFYSNKPDDFSDDFFFDSDYANPFFFTTVLSNNKMGHITPHYYRGL
jgi:hypothetical protein